MLATLISLIITTQTVTWSDLEELILNYNIIFFRWFIILFIKTETVTLSYR